jgi:hypothetical protein
VSIVIRIPFAQGYFVPSLIEIRQLVLEKTLFFKIWFSLLWDPSTPEDHDSKQTLICTMSKSFHMLSGSWNEKIFNAPTLFLHVCNHLPFEEDLTLHLINFEFSSPKDVLGQVWLNLACWFWRRRILKIFSAFSLFCCHPHPLGERIWLSFEQFWIPFT